MVKPDQVVNGLVLFAETEMLPSLDGWQLGLGGAALVLASQRAEALIDLALEHKAMKALGLVDDNGMIDIDAAIDAIKQSIHKRGKLTLDLSVFGKFALSEADIDKLRDYIIEAGR